MFKIICLFPQNPLPLFQNQFHLVFLIQKMAFVISFSDEDFDLSFFLFNYK